MTAISDLATVFDPASPLLANRDARTEINSF